MSTSAIASPSPSSSPGNHPNGSIVSSAPIATSPISQRQRQRQCNLPSLIPLRVDATTDDGHVRIIDTFLFDPNCWPIPLSPSRSSSSSLHELVEQNVAELAHTILSDSEVLGMGRTVRHFTNRVDLWSLQLYELIQHQLRVQLWDVIQRYHYRYASEEDYNTGVPGERPQQQQEQQQPATDALDVSTSSTDDTTGERSTTITRITLRLTVNNISITDDLDWDSSVPNMCPIQFAMDLANELNLPSEAAVAIATSIVEQLHGASMSKEKNLVPSSTPPMTATTAVLLESRDHVANVAHSLSLHRPTSLDRVTN